MTTRSFEFEGPRGHRLAAKLDLPDDGARAYAVFAHCFTCGKDIPAAARISAGLVAHGVGVLRFDFSGLGRSEGEFADTTFTGNIAELIAAARHLHEEYAPPTLLIGHSLGGAAVLAAAGAIDSIKAVAAIAAPSEPIHVAHLFAQYQHALETHGEAAFELGGKTYRIRREFVDDLAGFDLPEKVATLRCALLIMHSPRDEIVELSEARRIYDRAKHPKSFVSLDTADHMLRDRRDAQYVADVLAAWASRYL